MVLITRLQEFSTAKDRIAPFPADDDGGTCKSPSFYNISAEFNGSTRAHSLVLLLTDRWKNSTRRW
jgi:hypothetical protein